MTTNLPAVPDEDLATGLEDFEGGVVLPRLKVVQKDQVFLAAATNEEHTELVGIVLGMIRQRTMWNPEVSDGKSFPQCKAPDGKTGFPTMQAEDTDSLFPWDDVPFGPDQLPRDDEGRVTLACKACPFSQWRRDPKNPKKSKPPLCNEMYSFPILYSSSGDPEGPFDAAGIFSLQGSGIAPSNKYLSAFATTQTPVYSAVTKITLTRAERGQVVYSVPTFYKVGSSDVDEWPAYSGQLKGVREYLTAPPRVRNEEGAVATVQQSAPASSAAPAANVKFDEAEEAFVVDSNPAPTAAAAPADDDELPF